MRSTVILSILLLATLHLLSRIARSEDPAKQATTNQSRTEQHRRIEKLIDQLAAKEPKPKEGSPDLPRNEPEIWAAVDALHKEGTAAFGQLIAHYNDERFCCCEDAIAAEFDKVYHRSVGYVCRRIVEGQVRRYVAWNRGDPRGLPGYGRSIVPSEKKAAETWWAANYDKELWELQVDNVNFVLNLNRERLKLEVDPARRALCEEAILANEKLAAELIKSKMPKTGNPFRPYLER